MRLWLMTNVFPNPYQRTKGIFNQELVRALTRDHEVQVISPLSWVEEWRGRKNAAAPGSLERTNFLAGAQVHYPRYYYPPKVLRSHYGWFLWRSVRRTVENLLDVHPPEAVLGYWAHPDGEAAVRTARLTGVPAVVMVGGSDVLLLTRGGRRRRCILNVLHAADAVVAVSQDLKDKLTEFGISPDKVHVIYRGVNHDRFFLGNRATARQRLGISPEGKVLLWAGRMVPVKGLDVLLEAASLLRVRGDVRWYLVGEGPLRGRLAAECQARGLAETIKFVGPQTHDQLGDWYRAADLTVLPSRSEGVPNVLRESLACGTPFVASRVGGVPELAAGTSSRLVPPGNALALAQAINELLSVDVQPPAAASLPTSWADSAESLLDVVRPLVASSRPVHVSSFTDRAPVSETTHATATLLRPRQLLRHAMAATLPPRLFLVRGPAASRAVCLTFDDGPHPVHTPHLLAVLKEHRVAATFFVTGQNAEQHPELVRRLAAEGHTVGHHSFSHSEPALTSARELLEEVKRTRELLGELLGQAPSLFRPPKGQLTAQKLWLLWRARQTVVLWNKDPKDYACRAADEVRSWFDAHPLCGGDLVLLHDNRPHAVEVLPHLIQTARSEGLRFTTVAEWTS